MKSSLRKLAEPEPTEPEPTEPEPTESPFENCADVRGAEQAPIYPDHPRWNPGLDRDGDGVACE
ncbi:MAG: excalibur calcium-binding domain-containing protein [Bifidobacteriaceae bacterium]|nr:excalibur calcium-binding domain-containing protein [Bifidobacteriaceae bacterium]